MESTIPINTAPTLDPNNSAEEATSQEVVTPIPEVTFPEDITQ